MAQTNSWLPTKPYYLLLFFLARFFVQEVFEVVLIFAFLVPVAAFVADPACREVRALIVGDWGGAGQGDGSAPVVEALVSARDRLPNLMALFLGEIVVDESEISWITSAEIVRRAGETRLYNSLKIRQYTTLDEMSQLIDALAPHRIHVEEWLPKASLGGRVCDLRIVVIAGEPQQMVVRTSRTPLTNLHLGNRRGSLTDLMNKLSSAGRDSLQWTCQQAALCFPRSLQIGLDILFTPGFRNHALLEVNAFGDLLPRVYFQGKNCYESQVDSMLSSHVKAAKN